MLNGLLNNLAKRYIVRAQTFGFTTIVYGVELYSQRKFKEIVWNDDRDKLKAPFYIFDTRKSVDEESAEIHYIYTPQDLGEFLRENVSFNKAA